MARRTVKRLAEFAIPWRIVGVEVIRERGSNSEGKF
jgi:hypothetical protein